MIQLKIPVKIYIYGNMIHEKRISLGLTEEKLAELCDISDREIRNIEAGVTVPRFDTVLKLARAFEMDIGDFNILISEDDKIYAW